MSTIEVAEPTKNKGGRPRKNPEPQQPLLSPQQLLKLEAELYRQDFYEFFQAAFEIVTGSAYDPMNYVEAICQELQVAGLHLAKGYERDKHYDINIPPRTGKSVLISTMFPVWLWLHNPRLKIASVSHGFDLASDLMADSARLMSSDWFQVRWGNLFKLTKNNTVTYANDKGGYRKAFGAESGILGINADLVLLDDILNSKQAASDAQRKTILELVRRDAFSRMPRKDVGLLINIQQRLHIEDFSGWLQRNLASEFRHIKLPAESLSADNVSPREWYAYYQNGLLADVAGRLSRKDLDIAKILVGSLGYAQMFLQEPVAPGGGMFKEEWFERQVLELDTWHTRLAGRTPEWQLFIDGAETDNPKNDPTCLLLCCKLDNQLFVREVRWVREEFAQLLKTLERYLKQKEAEGIPVRRVLVEGKSIGKQIISVMRASACTVPFLELSHKFGKEPKHVRANRAVPFVEAGKLWLLKDTQCQEAWNEKFIQEVTSFVNGKGKTHDDAVDTMAYAIQNATAARIGIH